MKSPHIPCHLVWNTNRIMRKPERGSGRASVARDWPGARNAPPCGDCGGRQTAPLPLDFRTWDLITSLTPHWGDGRARYISNLLLGDAGVDTPVGTTQPPVKCWVCL